MKTQIPLSPKGIMREEIFCRIDAAIHFGQLEELKCILLTRQTLYPRVELLPCHLYLAVKYGHLDVVSYLLDRGLSADSLGPYDAADYWEYYGPSREARDKRYSIEKSTESLIRAGISELEKCEGLPRVNRISSTQTALHVCRSLDIAKLLVSKGADVNRADCFGFTPLIEAVLAQNYNLSSFLIESKANLDTPDASGSTAIYRAVETRNLLLVRLLALYLASNLIYNRMGFTPIHKAAEYGDTDLFLQLTNGYELMHIPNLKDNPTLLSMALKGGNQVIIGMIKK